MVDVESAGGLFEPIPPIVDETDSDENAFSRELFPASVDLLC